MPFKMWFFISIFTLLTSMKATENQDVTLTIELKNVNFKLGGTLYVMVVDKNDKPLYKVTRATSEKNAVFIFKNLPKGEYAARAFHDENNNGELDKGIFGQPTEGWGVTNDAKGFMSAPPFKKMLVGVYKDTKIAMVIGY
jgi:uncharacterized protein (DUF2141 family)